MLSSTSFARAAVVALPMVAGGCSSDVNPVKAAFIDAGYGPKAVQAPDFVERSRRDDVGYMPVGESAPKRSVRARTAEGQKSLQSELESARGRNEARGRAAEGAAKATGKAPGPGPAPAE